jgi:hypothetical protein
MSRAVIAAGRKDFDRHPTIKAPLPALIDRGHSPAADQANHIELRERLLKLRGLRWLPTDDPHAR